MTRLLVGLLILTFSCKPTENKLIGKYTYDLNFEVNGRLDLYPKNRFVFNARQGLASFGTRGNWKIENDRLILDSDKTLKDKSILELKDEIKGDRLKIRLFINSGDNDNRDLTTLSFAKVKITNGGHLLELEPNDLGEIEIKNQRVDSLIASTIGFVSLRANLNFIPKNNIDVILIEELGNMSFDNESFTIKGNRLIENNNSSGQKIKYKKN
jgi:hypothetical protein